MKIIIEDLELHKGMNISELDAVMDSFSKTITNDGKTIILRSRKPREYKDARFRVNLWFENDILERICLVAAAKQENPKYAAFKEVNELHKHWLENNYGKPLVEAVYGYTYVIDDIKIHSEYDPRSGRAEILYKAD